MQNEINKIDNELSALAAKDTKKEETPKGPTRCFVDIKVQSHKKFDFH